MTLKEFLAKFTGLSIPVFGLSWNPSEAEVTVARRVVAYLEDRRVLYLPKGPLDEAKCIESVSRIREFISTEIGRVAGPSVLSEGLRAMRKACRNFLETTETDRQRFSAALEDLRLVFGTQIAEMVVRHGLEVDADLEPVLRLAEAHAEQTKKAEQI